MEINRSNFCTLSTDDQIRALRGEKVERLFTVEQRSIDIDKRTAWLSIASEEPYERWWGIEVLDLGKKSIRTKRMRSGAPLLVGHDAADQVGVVEDFEITADRKLRILARFGKSARAEEVWQDVIDGIRRNTSVGYVIHDLVLERQEGDLNFYRVTDWEPYEGSLVAVPADPTVGLGRNLNPISRNNAMVHENEIITERKTRSELRGEDTEARRVQQLYAAGEAFPHNNGPGLARELINAGGTVEQFNFRILESMRGAQRPTATAQPYEAPGVHFGQGAREILQKPKNFSGPDAERNAYMSGMWLRGLYGNENAARWCRENGREIRAMSAAVLTQGGALVPDELSSAIIDISDSFGAYRTNADVWPMGSDTLSVPKSSADPEASFVGESGALPESDPSWGMVNLLAKKIGVVTRIPTELMEDSIIAVADRTALQIGRAFSKKEDQCGFLGDGTSAYGGMQGIFVKIVDGSHDAAKVLITSTHNTFAEIDAVDLAKVVGALPEIGQEGAAWYCSNTFWGNVFVRLLLGLTGNAVGDVAAKVPKFYAGYPVITSPVLPAGVSTDYSGKVMCGFGDLRLSSKFGSRRDIRIMLLTETYAAYDQVGVQATERFDIVNHDCGDNTTAGPMVGLVGN